MPFSVQRTGELRYDEMTSSVSKSSAGTYEKSF
ncbi:Protein of unknown function [Bacillus mycoides]|nr:Protein of unknown function [Bacillus mycoides]